jgi:hypothetical protein
MNLNEHPILFSTFSRPNSNLVIVVSFFSLFLIHFLFVPLSVNSSVMYLQTTFHFNLIENFIFSSLHLRLLSISIFTTFFKSPFSTFPPFKQFISHQFFLNLDVVDTFHLSLNLHLCYFLEDHKCHDGRAILNF